MEAMAMQKAGGQTDWLRALARASIDGPEEMSSSADLAGMGALAMTPESEKLKMEALALLRSMQARVGEVPKGLTLPLMSYIEGSLKTLGDTGPDHLKPMQVAALYLTEKTAEIARSAGLPEPKPSQWASTRKELEAEAKKEFDRKMKLAADPKPGGPKAPGELDAEALLALEERLGGPLPKNLPPAQVKRLDESLRKLDAEGPEALTPKESAALFLAPKAAEIAMKAGFQKPVHESGEMEAMHSLSAAESVALKKASQFNQAVGVEIARGVSFGDDESEADRMAKKKIQADAIDAVLPGSAAKGLSAVGEKIRGIHEIESANALDAKAGIARRPDAPSPFTKLE